MSESNTPTENEAMEPDVLEEVEASAEASSSGEAVSAGAASAGAMAPSGGDLPAASGQPDIPPTVLLPRLLARGEQLARRMSPIPEELWEEGGTAHLSKPEHSAGHDDFLSWSMDSLDADGAASFEMSEDGLAGTHGAAEERPGVFSWEWWLRPLWGLGVVALIAAVWWRLPDENISPISGTPSPHRRATSAAQTSRRISPPVRVVGRRKMSYPRLFPAHRLRPKGLSHPGQRPGHSPRLGAQPTSRPTSRPVVMRYLLAPVAFRWFMRRGQKTSEGRNGMVLQADDELRFAYSGALPSVQGAYLLVVMLDARGQLSPIYPAGKGVTLRLQGQDEPRRLFWLPDGAVLDDAQLSERIFVCASRKPHSIARVRQAAKQALESTTLRRLKALPLACIYQRSWLIHKQPKGQ